MLTIPANTERYPSILTSYSLHLIESKYLLQNVGFVHGLMWEILNVDTHPTSDVIADLRIKPLTHIRS